MASEHHKELSAYIKTVHETLRKNAILLGANKAWKQHCQEQQVLEKYANSMEMLATIYWEENSSSGKNQAQSRIEWAHQQCIQYYFDNTLEHFRSRELYEISKFPEIDIRSLLYMQIKPEKIKLLDVGSCYNPFKKYNCFEVTAVDIAPANKEVYECDFLNLSLSSKCCEKNVDTVILETQYFHVVVFSLLLEYFPSSEQRMLCCRNAYNLLKTEGILIIITPDSKHVGANAKIMKCWRYALANIGFSRIKYEKLYHLHCTIFRKSLHNAITLKWALLHKEDYMSETINIPQDFTTRNQKGSTLSSSPRCDQDIINMFTELPYP